MDVVRAREFESVPVGGGGGLAEAELDYLQGLRERGVPFFEERRERGRWWCRFAGYVGAVVLPGGRTLELLPKLEGATPAQEQALVMRMLAASGIMPVLEAEVARYAATPHLIEAYLAMTADLGLAALRHGLVHAYERRRFASPALRGRLRVGDQLTRYPGRWDRLLVEADRFTADTPVNRAVKGGIARMARLTRSPGTMTLCRELLSRLDTVGDLAPRDLHRAFAALTLDRRHARLRTLLDALALIVRDRGSAAAAGPQAPGPAWLFATDRLWEAYVARRLVRLLPHLEVSEQGPARPLTTDGCSILRPDIVISRGGQPLVVLDTKWKRLESPARPDQADLRQAYTYARIYRVAKATLLYPTWDERPTRHDVVVADAERAVTVRIQGLPLAADMSASFDQVLAHSARP